MKKETSFGSIDVLITKNNHIISEYLIFEKEGRAHKHEEWEICYITEGKGEIVIVDKKINVKSGDVCKIPPNSSHWMIPNPYMEILLVYSNQP